VTVESGITTQRGRSVYFRDPNNHVLELVMRAKLTGEARLLSPRPGFEFERRAYSTRFETLRP
jgi:hypothetical protein